MKKAQLMLLAGMMTAVTLATHPRKTFAQTQQQPLDSSVMRLTSKPIQQDTARTRKDKDIYLAFYCLNYSLRLAYSLDGNAYLDNTLEGDVKRAKQEVNSLLSSLPKRLELDEYLALILKNGVDNCITVAISQANAKSFQEGYGKYLLNEYPIANLVRQESYNYIGEQCEGSGLYRLAIANYTDAVLNSWIPLSAKMTFLRLLCGLG
ncbi:MAG: hypothetical protein NT051_00820 [Candidatus Micrarchaeota archaeon]|nr:hypothetical protein [Candidatus Micrarchaeota archaeon]